MAHTTKENRDVYYRKAKEDGYRARSAYKLIQIFQAYGIFHPIARLEQVTELLRKTKCEACCPHDDLKDVRKFDICEPRAEIYHCSNLPRIRNVVDLCAAPGSWTQCIRDYVYNEYFVYKDVAKALGKENPICIKLKESCMLKPVIIAVDLQDMAPVKGVEILKGDITNEKVMENIKELFVKNVSKRLLESAQNNPELADSSLAQIITCDGAPDVSGVHETDAYVQSCLIRAAISVCSSILDPNGLFVCKAFCSDSDAPIYRHVNIFFDDFSIHKPAASRFTSAECFVIARGFKPMGRITRGLNGFVHTEVPPDVKHEAKWLIPLMCCGDLGGYDKAVNS
ncbi:putative tRNA (cytidine(32)/guanosine(34)-2'-O)-methyltransferase 1 [Babesia sp. Xinjiang]|uniref:putative tRNA (cytidine(32)/guanosine(34)-2'-O)-methyltransferase 1 n=1 Tax=Babesia sp. Xinjiang TaxID=462227 RepID=UPI000A24F65E|nr:putative tRNA (cytidine(32)/guanosine(34)-2'-O)-methyltransferase 1 [Babesia sp. Xinjiang]ORM39571.1 putative tRNA (cytidine(32)/guanosine(34)-2'-O)-methyltransferase 1 [Babesia sp. Xinjiang]